MNSKRLSTTCLSTHALSSAVISTAYLAGRECGAPAISFLPTALPELALWLDARTNVFSVAGNYFTDETRTFTTSGFPSFPTGLSINGVCSPSGIVNGRNKYFVPAAGNIDGGAAELLWTGAVWRIEVTENDGANTNNYVYTATGNTAYPWQATWSNGALTPTATTIDVFANDGESVEKWGNKVPSFPSVVQLTPSLKPSFRIAASDAWVQFNSDLLSATFPFPQTWGAEWSYYVVSNPMTNAGESGSVPRYVLAHSGGPNSRGGFGSTVSALAIRNGSTVLFTDPTVLSDYIFENFDTRVFSARVSGSGFTLGNNLTFQTRDVSMSPSNSSNINVGGLSGSLNEGVVNTNLREVLVYRRRHTDAEAAQVVTYLAQKWGVAL